MTIASAALLVVVGFAAGVVNTLAGGGSFVSLAVLLWLGVPAPLANGTNRVAVLVQSLGAWATYRGEAAVEPLEAAVTVAGAFVGASLAVVVPADALERVLAAAMLGLVAFALSGLGVRLEVAVDAGLQGVGLTALGLVGTLQATRDRALADTRLGMVVGVAVTLLGALLAVAASWLVRRTQRRSSARRSADA